MIEIKGVAKLFKSGQKKIKAVDQVSLNVEKGEIFGVIGYSGAGKSTLIRMINQLERQTEGEIWIDGVPISRLSSRDLRVKRQKIGMIFQHFNLLWSRTVFDNIALPLEVANVPKSVRQERVHELIRLVGLEGKEQQYPSQLSGGQKQRVGIARALANQPTVLLCDEATSALDPKTTDSILELLKDINQKLGLTIILITHEMHVIQKICDRVAVMGEGRVVELGQVLQVFKEPKQQITKDFVKQITESSEALEAQAEWNIAEGKVVQCHFLVQTSGQPILSKLIRSCDVDVNVVQGKINKLKDSSYGTLFLHLTGSEAEINRAIQFLQEQQVEVEVLVG